MTKAEELWRKYQHDGWIGPTAFKAAIHEYGAIVRERNADKVSNLPETDASLFASTRSNGVRLCKMLCAAAIRETKLP